MPHDFDKLLFETLFLYFFPSGPLSKVTLNFQGLVGFAYLNLPIFVYGGNKTNKIFQLLTKKKKKSRFHFKIVNRHFVEFSDQK